MTVRTFYLKMDPRIFFLNTEYDSDQMTHVYYIPSAHTLMIQDPLMSYPKKLGTFRQERKPGRTRSTYDLGKAAQVGLPEYSIIEQSYLMILWLCS